MQAVVLSRGIRRLPHLAAFLTEFSRFAPTLDASARGDDQTTILGWGAKPTSRRARRLAQQAGLPYVALEDGFLRSYGLGVDDDPPLSLVVDPVGIYYDATRPSWLEQTLEQGGWQTRELLARAERCREALRTFRLSKYNAAPERDLRLLFPRDKRNILLVDQTAGDASVNLGFADAETFRTMLKAAEQDEPDARLIIKTHPDVIAGKKRGYLAEIAGQRGHLLLDASVNPWSLFDVVDGVYTVTSQLGFEALLAGVKVRCFGMPFYAGWGVTQDQKTCPRRTQQRSVTEIFAAAYLLYARYVDPFTGQPCSIEDTIDLLADLRRHYARNHADTVCLGFSRWKRGFARSFLAHPGGSPVVFRRSARSALAAAEQIQTEGRPARVVVWASAKAADRAEEASRHNIPVWRMEDGFLRSVGLGCTLVQPQSLVLDDCGIYYDPSQPSALERILSEGNIPEQTIERARRLRQRIVRLKVTKYNVGKRLALPPDIAADQRRRILVPGQVEDDASIRRGSADIRSNAQLLAAVRAAAPDACILFKPHPDVETGLRAGHVPDTVARQWCDAVIRDTSILDLIEMVDAVHTISSLAGFEALLRGKAVTTYGLPFYAGWGLTDDRLRCERRTRQASLDELVAATLILYPAYVDPVTGRPCRVETVIDRLGQHRRSRSAWALLARARRLTASLGLPFSTANAR
ncbi:MAG: hypothetical protein RKL24_11525 [Defluviicoccus sp.]|nr:hypothetical protein [Defluviicoccus sp.]